MTVAEVNREVEKLQRRCDEARREYTNCLLTLQELSAICQEVDTKRARLLALEVVEHKSQEVQS